MSITSAPGTYFWSNGSAWGTVSVEEGGKATIHLMHGVLSLEEFALQDKGSVILKNFAMKEGDSREITVKSVRE